MSTREADIVCITQTTLVIINNVLLVYNWRFVFIGLNTNLQLSVPFSQQDTQEFPSQEDKIGWFPSQLQIEQSAIRNTTIFYIVRQNGRGKRPQIYPSVGGGGATGEPIDLLKISPPS